MKKLTAASITVAMLFAGCLGATDDDVDLDGNSVDKDKLLEDLAIAIEAQADGSYKFSAEELPGLTYAWDFGDLTGGTGATATHEYLVDSGTMSVVLQVSDGKGNALHFGKTLTIGSGANSNPVAAFSFDGPFVQVGAPFMVDASATTDPDGDRLKVSWYLAEPGSAPASGDGGGDPHAGHMGADPFTTHADAGHDHGGDDAAAEDGGHGDHQHAGGLDTGNIMPGESAELVFMNAGTYQMHCHPHPHMVQQVKVVPGAAAEAEVVFVQNSFQPPIVEIAPGGKVTYTNKEDVSALFHTSTEAAFAPHGEKLALTDLSGELTIDELGEYDLVLVVEDGKGQLGVTAKRVKVVEEVPNSTFETTFEGTYDASVTSSAAGQTNAKQHAFDIEFPGHAIISADFEASYGELRFRLLDSAGTELARGLNMEAMLDAGRYTVEVVPEDPGFIAQATYTIDVLVHLDLNADQPDDGGDGHAHQH